NAVFLRFQAFCWPFAQMYFTALSPDSVDIRIHALECADTARRSRTTERSLSVSEEVEERLMRYFLLTYLCGISHRNGALSVQSALRAHG
ncbi:hypothetical protein, partial [Fructilactobacillus lindneri]|uniref:hypothetical protein n=1 Tax=Fructilactobacillus lindneri TaxID=53444 RepID=UPI001CDB2B74